jgi:hypothetical protein
MAGFRIAGTNEGGRQTQPRQLIRTRCPLLALADIGDRAGNVCFRGG